MSSPDTAATTPQAYDNSHRALLQALLSRPHLTYPDAQPILSAILTAHSPSTPPTAITEQLLGSYLDAINAALSPLDYQVRHTVRQGDGGRTPVYALVNTTSDPQTQLATGLSADEVAYVKRVIDAMFERYGGRGGGAEVFAVKSTEAVGLARGAGRGRESGGGEGGGVTMARAEEVLGEMCEGGWFERSEAGFVGLGVRGLMELNGWLREMYDELDEGEEGRRIRDCGACKDIVTVGQRCSNRDCGFRLHDVCVQRYFHSRTEKKCPKCGSPWTGKDFVGERAARGFGERDRISNGGRGPEH